MNNYYKGFMFEKVSDDSNLYEAKNYNSSGNLVEYYVGTEEKLKQIINRKYNTRLTKDE